MVRYTIAEKIIMKERARNILGQKKPWWVSKMEYKRVQRNAKRLSKW